MDRPPDVFGTTFGGTDSSQAIVESDAKLGFESDNNRPPADMAVEFVDWPFTKEGAAFDEHLETVAREQPMVTVAPDIEDDVSLEEAIEMGDRLLEHAEAVILVPKEVHPDEVPDRFRVGVPVADFGSDAPHQLTEYRESGELHLLGGSPTEQLEIGSLLPSVTSLDTASVIRGAEMGNIWAPTRERNWHPTENDEIDFYDRVTASYNNIVEAWAARRQSRPGDFQLPSSSTDPTDNSQLPAFTDGGPSSTDATNLTMSDITEQLKENGVTARPAKALNKQYDDIAEVMQLSRRQLTSIDGVGEGTADTIKDAVGDRVIEIAEKATDLTTDPALQQQIWRIVENIDRVDELEAALRKDPPGTPNQEVERAEELVAEAMGIDLDRDDGSTEPDVDGFDPRDLFEADVADQFDVEIEYQDVEIPENVPEGEKEHEVNFAENILLAGGARTGFSHHDEVSRSLTSWARDHEDHPDNPGYWEEHAYGLTPKELNRGQFEGDLNEQFEKARTVIAWASDNIDHDVLRDIEDETYQEAREALEAAAEVEVQAQSDREFRDDPPDELNGWMRFEPAHGDVKLAYCGNNMGTPSVAAVYRDRNMGDLTAAEFVKSEWSDNGGDPNETTRNRPIDRVTNDLTVWGDLRSHLTTFDADPADPPITSPDGPDDTRPPTIGIEGMYDPVEEFTSRVPTQETDRLHDAFMAIRSGLADQPEHEAAMISDHYEDVDSFESAIRNGTVWRSPGAEEWATEVAVERLASELGIEAEKPYFHQDDDSNDELTGRAADLPEEFGRELQDLEQMDTEGMTVQEKAERRNRIEELRNMDVDPRDRIASDDDPARGIEETPEGIAAMQDAMMTQSTPGWKETPTGWRAEGELDTKVVIEGTGGKKFVTLITDDGEKDTIYGGLTETFAKEHAKTLVRSLSPRDLEQDPIERWDMIIDASDQVPETHLRVPDFPLDESKEQDRSSSVGISGIYDPVDEFTSRVVPTGEPSAPDSPGQWHINDVDKVDGGYRAHYVADNEGTDTEAMITPADGQYVIEVGDSENRPEVVAELGDVGHQAAVDAGTEYLEQTPPEEAIEERTDTDSPVVDDRDRQGTLDVGESAARTADRESKVAEGSEEFVDDRDGGDGIGGGQASLGTTTETMDGQADLSGETATVEETPEFVEDEGEVPTTEIQAIYDPVQEYQARAARGVARRRREAFEDALDQAPDQEGRPIAPEDQLDDAVGAFGQRRNVDEVPPNELKHHREQMAANQNSSTSINMQSVYDPIDEFVSRATGPGPFPDVDTEVAGYELIRDTRNDPAANFPQLVYQERIDEDDGPRMVAVEQRNPELEDEPWHVSRARKGFDDSIETVGNFEAFEPALERAKEWMRNHQPTEDTESADTTADQEVIDPEVEGTGTDTIEFELGSREEANQFRDKLEDGSTTDKYDRRHKSTEVFEGAVSESMLNELTAAQAEAEAEEAEKFGQADLTDSERSQLEDRSDWQASEDLFHARAAKAILQGKGVDDWISFYDPELTTDEHREIAEQAKQDEQGQRMDEGGREGAEAASIADALAGVKSEQCDHARDHCKMGDPDACEFLAEECGLSETELEQIRAGIDAVGEDPTEVMGGGADASIELNPQAEPLLDLAPDSPPADEQEPADAAAAAEPSSMDADLPGPALNALSGAWQGYRLARVDAKKARDEAAKWARVINGIRMVNGQPPMVFDELPDLPERPIPEDESEEYPTEQGQMTLEEACHGGRQSGVYDPCMDLANHSDD